MTVKELSAFEGFSIGTMPNGEREVEGVYIGDLLSWVMGKAQEGDAWITIMSNINIVAVASLADTACIILAEGVKLDDEIIATATQKGVNILYSSQGAYEIACVLHGAL
ncbi:MAG: hypothetical protein IKU89_04765 [Oscillospiraceae bacterium]|nr:hypothetical protein [Oscillospiraceae bacterium]